MRGLERYICREEEWQGGNEQKTADGEGLGKREESHKEKK